MRRALACLCLLLLIGGTARAEAVDETLKGLDFSAWQSIADEADASMDVLQLVRALASGEQTFDPEMLMELLRGLLLGETRGLFPRLMAVLGPALLWALVRRLLGDGPVREAAGCVCFLTGAGAVLSLFAGQMNLTRLTIRRLGRLTEGVFPVLMALMSATGGAASAGMLQPLATFGGGAMNALLERSAEVLCGSAAVLAVIGNLTGHMRLKSLFGLCRSVGNWLFGSIMAGFLGLMGMSGLMGSVRDGVSIRAAKYAVDNLLPVVGGDVADTMDAMVLSAVLVRNAAGVTGMLVMLAVCLRPLIGLALTMLMYRLAAALCEPVAEGPLVTCAEQMAQATQMLLVALAVSVALFITLTGVTLAAGNAVNMFR